jgi:hypothetical protein
MEGGLDNPLGVRAMYLAGTVSSDQQLWANQAIDMSAYPPS